MKYNNNISNWILDSCASIQVCSDFNLLSNVKSCHEKITLANVKSAVANYVGEFSGYINSHLVKLENVFFSLEINKNLISVSLLTKQHYKIIFINK